MDPKVILFDEPTSALDPEMVNEVLDTMTALAYEGMTMIVVTHEMGFARKAADRIVFMDEGQSSSSTTPRRFFTARGRTRAKDFLGRSSPTDAADADARGVRLSGRSRWPWTRGPP